MWNGTIKYFNFNRGFGFIKAEYGEDIFVHISNVDIEEGQYPQKGQKVSFDLAAVPKGQQAVNVQLIREDRNNGSEENEAAF